MERQEPEKNWSCILILFFFYENRAKIKNVFFPKVRFSQRFPQKCCFLCLIFVRFWQQFPPKICFLCLIFAEIFPNFSPAGICLRKQRWGICMTHSPKRGESAVFAEFHEFLSCPKNFLDRTFRICPLKNSFLRSQDRLSFYFF